MAHPIRNRASTPRSSRGRIRIGRSRAASGTTSRRKPRTPSPVPSASSLPGESFDVNSEEQRMDIRTFTIDVPEEQLVDMRRRIAATKWPDREVDSTQGVQLDVIQALARYWATDYDWRAFERRFAALPHFITEIDGVDIHFIHVRSEHEDALPLIVTHGWPGSTVEQLKIIDPLTQPTAHAAAASDAFHLVIPSLPGHGF